MTSEGIIRRAIPGLLLLAGCSVDAGEFKPGFSLTCRYAMTNWLVTDITPATRCGLVCADGARVSLDEGDCPEDVSCVVVPTGTAVYFYTDQATHASPHVTTETTECP